ncbi:N-succinylarginine dihydrolase [Marinobacterium marinum]|uniref:N-succinylarginine dihydrolase n=1 Tax=Marinobacterium marinum TaxID=2756129 RepID=A0A7W2ACY7_9GAMM|nr:N-succinylarginine dihydrolase [Marinobacterium marinum]MBA4503009.1 N-succinylarginine dihydrolase [Marinobacterium marinum]
MRAIEANFDGLVGPTHNYAGLAVGNLASQRHQAQASNPREAALQGLAKMKALHDLGLVQGVLAPLARPDLKTLRRLGFYGNDAEVIRNAALASPRLLAACCSASSMWVANAATVTPSADAADQRVHFTPANLASQLHRSLETEHTARVLQATFNDSRHFVHHPALPTVAVLGDEGAANHTRLGHDYGAPGVALFAYGSGGPGPEPTRYPGRQTLEASRAVARQHRLDESQVVFARQHPEAIDQGVFHNDVIAVGNLDILFCHEHAFYNQEQVVRELNVRLGGALRLIQVAEQDVALADAVRSYLFNSQLLRLPDGRTLLVVPAECRQVTSVWQYLQELEQTSSVIDKVQVFDLRQSMHNGGGPACLRLRVVMNEAEQSAFNQATRMDDALYQRLVDWVGRHYRDRLMPADLADPQLMDESFTALDELSRLLQLGAIYPFQR